MTRTGPPPGATPVGLEPIEREDGGEAGRPDRGRVARAHAVGERHHPRGRHPDPLGEAPVMGHPEVVALREHRGARLDPVGAGEDGPGEVDARDERVAAGHPVARRDHHGVLEVEGRPLDRDLNRVVAQLIVVELADGRLQALAVLADHECAEAHSSHSTAPGTLPSVGRTPFDTDAPRTAR